MPWHMPLCRWEGPDEDGYLWLMIDNKQAVAASKSQVGVDVGVRVCFVPAVFPCGLLPLPAASHCGAHSRPSPTHLT